MILLIVGLGISLLGTIFLALSVKRGKVLAWKDSKAEPEYMTVFKLGMFRWGLALLALGFLLQIWGVSLG
jgi:hypothetical protein